MNNKILILDDEEPIRDMLTALFEDSGYEVITASSAEDALKILKTEFPPIMFFDLNLPGLNGIELCKKIRKDYPMSFIFAMTGYTSLFELSDCREAGFDDYFEKPVEGKLFLETVRHAFIKINRWKKRKL